MRIIINTNVEAPLDKVKEGFTEELFVQLNPPFPPVKVSRFDGCETGHLVSLELNFIVFKQLWVSDIIEDKQEGDKWYFIDQGRKLPFFLKRWKHHHEVRKSSIGSVITDDIQFSTGTILTDILFYPLLYFQFLYRKPIYRKIFSQK